MATIEEFEIGLGLEFGQGEFVKTELIDGVLSLKKQEDAGEEELYEVEGYWESRVFDLQHKFREYKKVSLNSSIPPSAQVGIEVRTSDNGDTWTEYIPTTPDGSFQTPVQQYIQVKVTLYAGYTAISNKLVFDNDDSLKKLDESFWFQITDGKLGLKQGTVALPMELDEEYTGQGYVYVAELDKRDFIEETITKLDIL